MGTLGDILFRDASVWDNLAGNTTITKKILSQTGTGTLSAAPVWSTIVNADLPLSGAVAGTYGSSIAVPVVTVNNRGIITAISTTSITSTTGFVSTGVTLTNDQLVFGAGGTVIKVGNLTGDVTTAGGTATTLSTTGVVASTYGSSTAIPIITVDAKGRITTATTTSITVSSIITGSPSTNNLVKFASSTTITNTDLSGDITTSGFSTTTLSTTGVTAGTYGSSTAVPVITFDAKGRATAASTTAISGGSGTSVLVQEVFTAFTTMTTGTTTIPVDDTIPQNTEGNEYFTRSIVPTNSTHKLEINVIVQASHSAIDTWIAAALFQDTTANALACGAVTQHFAAFAQPIVFTHIMDAGTTSTTTFKVRAGGSNAGTTTVNGSSGLRVYGGVYVSSIVIKEYIP